MENIGLKSVIRNYGIPMYFEVDKVFLIPNKFMINWSNKKYSNTRKLTSYP